MKKIIACAMLVASLQASAVLGPIPIILNTEYRINNPVIQNIAQTLSFDEQDIKNSGANNFVDFLATIPGVQLFNPVGNAPSVFIRGAQSSHTLFIIDGVKINSPISLNGGVEYSLQHIALNDIEKVEVIKSSGSILYGSSAIAGVISITTKRGVSGKRFHTTINFGAHNAKRYNFVANNGDKRSYIRLSTDEYTTDGISAKSDNDEKDGIKNHNNNFKFGLKNSTTAVDFGLTDSKSNIDYDSCSFPSINNCYLKRKLRTSNLGINHKISEKWQTNILFNKTKVIENHYYNQVLQAFSGDNFQNTEITILNNIKIQNSLLNIGLSKLDDKNQTKNRGFNSKNLFINWQQNVGDLDINTGARYIKHNTFGDKVIYNMGINKYLNNNAKITLNYNTAYKNPTLKNLYGWDFSGISGGGNMNLKPESAKNIELGFERQYSWGKIKAAVYNSKVTDAIDWIDDGYANIDKLINQGIDLAVDTDVASYDVALSYNFVDSKKNNEKSQNLRRPKNSLNLLISKQYHHLGSSIQITRKSSSLDTDNVRLNGYTLVNLIHSYDFNNKTKLVLNIHNIFDKNYEIASGYSTLGRSINLGLTHNF